MATVYSIFACVLCCNGQKHYVGTDIISGLCFGTVQLRLSHSFAANWSAGADIGTNILSYIKKEDETSRSHEETLTGSNDTMDKTLEDGLPPGFIGIHVDYWPSGTFNGLMLSIGGQIKERGEPDITVGIGYSIRIHKGLGADIIYRCGIKETHTTGKLPTDGIKAGVYYVF
jgi:hypothetical protein